MNTNNTTMEEFFNALALKKQSPYYASLQQVTKITVSQVQNFINSKPQPTRGWVMWVNTVESDRVVDHRFS